MNTALWQLRSTRERFQTVQEALRSGSHALMVAPATEPHILEQLQAVQQVWDPFNEVRKGRVWMRPTPPPPRTPGPPVGSTCAARRCKGGNAVAPARRSAGCTHTHWLLHLKTGVPWRQYHPHCAAAQLTEAFVIVECFNFVTQSRSNSSNPLLVPLEACLDFVAGTLSCWDVLYVVQDMEPRAYQAVRVRLARCWSTRSAAATSRWTRPWW